MAAKRAPRWGVHYAIGDSIFTEGLYQARSSFTVRGRTQAEAMAAARNHLLARRQPGRVDFIVQRLAS